MSADVAIGAPENAAAAAMRPAAAAPPAAAHLAPDTMPRWRALLESHWRARLERVTELSLATTRPRTPAPARRPPAPSQPPASQPPPSPAAPSQPPRSPAARSPAAPCCAGPWPSGARWRRSRPPSPGSAMVVSAGANGAAAPSRPPA